MKIEIAASAPGRLIGSKRLGNFRNRNSGGNNVGGGRRRFSRSSHLSYLIYINRNSDTLLGKI